MYVSVILSKLDVLLLFKAEYIISWSVPLYLKVSPWKSLSNFCNSQIKRKLNIVFSFIICDVHEICI